MIPPAYLLYFSTMSAVGATLFGLIFVVISIAPEAVANANAPLERQAKATTAYTALLNPLIISLFALVPNELISVVVISVSLFGFISCLGLALMLYRNFFHWNAKARSSLFILVGFVLYGYETYYGIRLMQSPTDIAALNTLANIMIAINVFGVFRAWELVGIRQFHVRDWLFSLGAPGRKQNTDSSETAPEDKK